MSSSESNASEPPPQRLRRRQLSREVPIASTAPQTHEHTACTTALAGINETKARKDEQRLRDNLWATSEEELRCDHAEEDSEGFGSSELLEDVTHRERIVSGDSDDVSHKDLRRDVTRTPSDRFSTRRGEVRNHLREWQPRRLAAQLEKHRVRLRQDLGGLTRRLVRMRARQEEHDDGFNSDDYFEQSRVVMKKIADSFENRKAKLMNDLGFRRAASPSQENDDLSHSDDYFGHSRVVIRKIADSIETRKAKLKSGLGRFKRRNRRKSAERSLHTTDAVSLVSIEPLWSKCGEPNIQYRANLVLDSGPQQHLWQTGPFTLDDLLSILVSARRDHIATSLYRITDSTFHGHYAKAKDVSSLASPPLVIRKRSYVIWILWYSMVWALPLLLAWKLAVCLAALLLPAVHVVLLRLQWTKEGGISVDIVDWLVACIIAVQLISSLLILLAGLAEVSFLPTKMILQLEMKDETAKVRQQLQLLLKESDGLNNLKVCNFLNMGMPKYYGSSETHKEGLCFCRLHESADVYFAQARRPTISLVCCTCTFRCPARQRNPWKERWLVLRKDGISLFSSLQNEYPTDMLWFDPNFSLFRSTEDYVLVRGSSWLLEIAFVGQQTSQQAHIQSWCNAITLTAQLSDRLREQRYGSFAPVRFPAPPKEGDEHLLRRSLARHLIGGRAVFRKIAEAILNAKYEVFILGWWVFPHLQLVRDDEEPLPGITDSRLSSLLGDAASRGVRVYVLIYHETAMVHPNNSEWAEAELRGPNINVARHRSRFDINRLWSHHEKVVVVDQQLAFVGGIDLCLGRYDTSRHHLRDWPCKVFPGQDYSNPRIKDHVDVRGDEDILDRLRQPRLPWQDLTCAVLGQPARDVARHCIERWNHAKSTNPLYESLPSCVLERKQAVCNKRLLGLPDEGDDSRWPREFGAWHECTTQVIRSAGLWSAGTMTEASIHTAYCDLIQESERLVYIENQFFCSGLDGDQSIGNRVGEALYRRIARAHKHKEFFHVIIVLPLLPAFEGVISPDSKSATLTILNWQNRTFKSIRHRLASDGILMMDYISVFGLRSHDVLDDIGPVTEEVYVHSKLMIVDDRYVVIGSANINDRSLLGTRDSELDLVLRSTEFASKFRQDLFAKHLGLDPESSLALSEQPFDNVVLEKLRGIARQNTQIYDDLFGVIPSDNVRSWADLQTLRASGNVAHLSAGLVLGDFTRIPSEDAIETMSRIQGFLVEFPFEFLADEDLTPPMLSTGALTPEVFN